MSASWQTGRNATGARSPDPPDDESSSLFAAAHSTDMITMTMGELETLKRTMKARLDDVQKRVDRAMQRTEALQTENKRLASLVQELTEAKLTSEATDTFAALRALPATRGANGETVDAEAERRRAELRRRPCFSKASLILTWTIQAASYSGAWSLSPATMSTKRTWTVLAKGRHRQACLRA